MNCVCIWVLNQIRNQIRIWFAVVGVSHVHASHAPKIWVTCRRVRNSSIKSNWISIFMKTWSWSKCLITFVRVAIQMKPRVLALHILDGLTLTLTSIKRRWALFSLGYDVVWFSYYSQTSVNNPQIPWFICFAASGCRASCCWLSAECALNTTVWRSFVMG